MNPNVEGNAVTKAASRFFALEGWGLKKTLKKV